MPACTFMLKKSRLLKVNVDCNSSVQFSLSVQC